MELQDWLENKVTIAMLEKLNIERINALEGVISAENKDKACGLVIGLTNAINIIENLEEGDLDAT